MRKRKRIITKLLTNEQKELLKKEDERYEQTLKDISYYPPRDYFNALYAAETYHKFQILKIKYRKIRKLWR